MCPITVIFTFFLPVGASSWGIFLSWWVHVQDYFPWVQAGPIIWRVSRWMQDGLSHSLSIWVGAGKAQQCQQTWYFLVTRVWVYLPVIHRPRDPRLGKQNSSLRQGHNIISTHSGGGCSPSISADSWLLGLPGAGHAWLMDHILFIGEVSNSEFCLSFTDRFWECRTANYVEYFKLLGFIFRE